MSEFQESGSRFGPTSAETRRIGKYEIIKELGRGATSVVYKAYDPFQDREVAVKAVYPEALGDDEHGHRYRKLFVTEASLAGKLAHPHIVAIYDAVAGAEASYIVMEYVDGSTLERFTQLEHLLPLSRVLEIIYKCARALDYAACEGVIHRDIKPANILLSGEADIKSPILALRSTIQATRRKLPALDLRRTCPRSRSANSRLLIRRTFFPWVCFFISC